MSGSKKAGTKRAAFTVAIKIVPSKPLAFAGALEKLERLATALRKGGNPTAAKTLRAGLRSLCRSLVVEVIE